MNFKMIRNILGWILLFEAGFMLVPAVTAVVYGEWRELAHFAVAMLLCLAIGALSVWKKPENTTLYAREGFVTVALSWLTISFFGAVPFFTTGAIPNFLDAFFEMVSGFTTTGASIVSSVEDLPMCINMWRCFSHWVGGMGVLVFIMAFVSLSGGQNMHIMKAESPGPSVGKLVPRVRTTAMILYGIYLIMTFVMFVFLLFGDMNAYEALCTAFGTAGTGGFGIRNDSMASFSAYSQIVVTVFMLLFSVNFSCYYLLLLRRLRDAFNVELRRFLIIVAVAIGLITWNVYTAAQPLFDSFGETLRHSAFTVASIISTSGYATADFNLWPNLACTLIVAIMFIGACAGSTGGGFQVSRLYILVRGAANELGNLAHPHRVKKVRMDRNLVDTDVVRTANIYLVWYVIIFAVSVILVSFDPHITTDPFVTNFSAVATTLNNVGPGLGMVGPTSNFACYGWLSKLVLIADMLIGRLELFPMLILCTPSTWKKSPCDRRSFMPRRSFCRPKSGAIFALPLDFSGKKWYHITVYFIKGGNAVRLDRYLSLCGVASRTEASRATRAGEVLVDGVSARRADMHIDPDTATVIFRGVPVIYRQYTYILMHKPDGVVSATEDGREETVLDLLPDELRRIRPPLFPCGRLDKHTTGLMLLTNNGDLSHRLLAPARHVDKTYRYRVKCPLSDEDITALESGVDIGGYLTAPCRVERDPDDPDRAGHITLHEGKYHQIKLMMEARHNQITELRRVTFGPLTLDGSLAPGAWRLLTDDELAALEAH